VRASNWPNGWLRFLAADLARRLVLNWRWTAQVRKQLPLRRGFSLDATELPRGIAPEAISGLM
jgi:hypothetical protein